MKYAVYVGLAILAGVLFLPNANSTQLRNVPLLIALLSVLLLAVLIQLFRYAVFMAKAKKRLQNRLIRLTQSKFYPWAARGHGHYSFTLEWEGQTVQILLLVQKKRYQRYHFDRVDTLEFYRANRVVFRQGNVEGAKISKLVEVKQVGKQKLQWDDGAAIRVVLFDRLPSEITDSTQKELLGAGDRICGSDVYVLDWETLCEKCK